MAVPEYKEYSDEENRIYEDAVSRIREHIKKGMHIDEACAVVEVKDVELKRFIVEDVLKIMIAEMRFMQKLPLEIVAKELRVPLERVARAFAEMMEDVMHTQAAKHGAFDPESLGFIEPKGNA